jgi:predicted GNAT family N-acyltransferase
MLRSAGAAAQKLPSEKALKCATKLVVPETTSTSMFTSITNIDSPDFVRLLLAKRGLKMHSFESEQELIARIESSAELRVDLLSCTLIEPALEKAQHLARAVDSRIAAQDALR